MASTPWTPTGSRCSAPVTDDPRPDSDRPRRWGCDQCWPGSAEEAWAATSRQTGSRELVDDSHFGISVGTCPACGQSYVSIFEEDVDWTDGDDPQYWTVVPLTAAEVAELAREARQLTTGQVLRVGDDRRTLHRDYPKGAEPRVYWREAGREA